ncbi:MAG: hypothetical protein R3Y64_01365 [Peptostreptococcaceae bacterium]
MKSIIKLTTSSEFSFFIGYHLYVKFVVTKLTRTKSNLSRNGFCITKTCCTLSNEL